MHVSIKIGVDLYKNRMYYSLMHGNYFYLVSFKIGRDKTRQYVLFFNAWKLFLFSLRQHFFAEKNVANFFHLRFSAGFLQLSHLKTVLKPFKSLLNKTEAFQPDFRIQCHQTGWRKKSSNTIS
jgi:hypothetical protein